MSQVYAVIPAFEPLESLVPLAEKVVSLPNLAGLVIVDDGSKKAGTAEIFTALEKLPRTVVLHHAQNQGKGASMKTAFRYLLEKAENDLLGAVTIDADGQHLPTDIEKVIAVFLENPDDYTLGVRDFHNEEHQIPWRSRFGNVMTEKVFDFLTGTDLKDTQTGLRVYPKAFMQDALKIKSNRYEFELEALLRFCRNGDGSLRQVNITTVYEESNPSSHFRPLRDSLRIYTIFLKFIGSSIICCLIDCAIFAILYFSLSGREFNDQDIVLISLLIARAISVTVNFIINKEKVFRSNGHWLSQFLSFALLAIFLFLSSYFGIKALEKIHWHPLFSKIVLETLLFILSFFIQNSVIFRKKREHTNLPHPATEEK